MKTKTYLSIKAPSWYDGPTLRRGMCYLHVFVYWYTHRCVIPKGYAIHHIDGNILNNCIDNLQMLSGSDHASHHSSLRGKVYHLICPTCGMLFTRRKLSKLRTGLTFCSRQCIGSYGFSSRHGIYPISNYTCSNIAPPLKSGGLLLDAIMVDILLDIKPIPRFLSKYICSLQNRPTKQCPICNKFIQDKLTYCSQDCAHKATRRVPRPPIKDIMNKLADGWSFLALGHFYKVSDNTIRKWLK